MRRRPVGNECRGAPQKLFKLAEECLTVVTLTDTTGETRFAMTNPFGFYRFGEVSLGETYFLSVSHKRYQFAPQGLTLTGEVNGLNFIAQQ